MKKLTLLIATVITCSGTSSASVFAIEGLTAHVSVTNNYVWRGISQTQDQSAVSGGIDYATEPGFNIGAWVSNVDFENDTSAEVDLYAGYSFNLEQLAIDVGYLFYGYPGGEALDFSEVYASVSWEFLTLGYNVLANSDSGGDFGDSDYIYANLAVELTDGLELGFHYGLSNFDGAGDYSDYGVSLSKNGFSLAVTDVNDNAIESNFLIAVSYTVDFDL